MNTLLESIFETKKFKNSNGEIVHVHSETFREQCVFLQEIIRKNNFKNSIEIGFAFGTSTLAITEEITKNSGKHTVIDPVEISYWGGHGLDLINQAGFTENLIFIEDFSQSALPELLKSGKKYDFAYIDTTKILDHLIVDFFYLDKILEIGGIITFDDVNFPGIRKLLRFLAQFPHYEIVGQHPENKEQSNSSLIKVFLKLFPNQKNILRQEITDSDYMLGVNASCIALKKTGHDNRRWDWHTNF